MIERDHLHLDASGVAGGYSADGFLPEWAYHVLQTQEGDTRLHVSMANFLDIGGQELAGKGKHLHLFEGNLGGKLFKPSRVEQGQVAVPAGLKRSGHNLGDAAYPSGVRAPGASR